MTSKSIKNNEYMDEIAKRPASELVYVIIDKLNFYTIGHMDVNIDKLQCHSNYD